MQEYLFHSTTEVVSWHDEARMEQPFVSKWDRDSIPAPEGVRLTFHGAPWTYTT
jgi:hypothetical protein